MAGEELICNDISFNISTSWIIFKILKSIKFYYLFYFIYSFIIIKYLKHDFFTKPNMPKFDQ